MCFVLSIYNVLFRVAYSRSPLALNLPTPRWNDASRRWADRWSREVPWSSPAIVLCFCVSFPFIILLLRAFTFGSRVQGSRSPSIPRRHSETTIRRIRTGRRREQGAAVYAYRIRHAILLSQDVFFQVMGTNRPGKRECRARLKKLKAAALLIVNNLAPRPPGYFTARDSPPPRHQERPSWIHGFTCSPQKCHFGRTDLEFLVHAITADGNYTQPRHVEAIFNAQPPTNRKQLR